MIEGDAERIGTRNGLFHWKDACVHSLLIIIDCLDVYRQIIATRCEQHVTRTAGNKLGRFCGIRNASPRALGLTFA